MAARIEVLAPGTEVTLTNAYYARMYGTRLRILTVEAKPGPLGASAITYALATRLGTVVWSETFLRDVARGLL